MNIIAVDVYCPTIFVNSIVREKKVLCLFQKVKHEFHRLMDGKVMIISGFTLSKVHYACDCLIFYCVSLVKA